MKKMLRFMLLFSVPFILFSCHNNRAFNYNEAVEVAELQVAAMLNNLDEPGCYPRTVTSDGELYCTGMTDWTEGFFPGSLWYLYELSNSDFFKRKAVKWTEHLEPMKNVTHHHDIGFIMYCSFGNAYRLTGNKKYRDILIEAANAAITRFSPEVGSIKSWNQRDAWDGETTWYYPVIVDNMMNLELLYFATRETGDSTYYHIANEHAETTARNNIRDDYGTYHVVNYDPDTGDVLHKQTCQGFSDNSTWARGQAWTIYGYVMAYRETGREDFLENALGLADYFIQHPNLPQDYIPYWDFNVDEYGYNPDWDYNPNRFDSIPRDASAAAITASALLELSTLIDDGEYYFQFAEKQLRSLASSPYLAEPGTNNGFVLKHSVGSIPHNQEIDVPLVYADYYFLEAIQRYKNIKK
ncbi:glycoside hydrolase family 88 protein [Marinilabiliaceae bacterium ANBcel2]|nr:glycoside hydrolase family 88 protein [Marinilabiliaceae bacterium ANBcel2]